MPITEEDLEDLDKAADFFDDARKGPQIVESGVLRWYDAEVQEYDVTVEPKRLVRTLPKRRGKAKVPEGSHVLVLTGVFKVEE